MITAGARGGGPARERGDPPSGRRLGACHVEGDRERQASRRPRRLRRSCCHPLSLCSRPHRTPRSSASYYLSVSLDGRAPTLAPLELTISPGEIDAHRSVADGEGLHTAIAGARAHVHIAARDAHDNPIAAGSAHFGAELCRVPARDADADLGDFGDLGPSALLESGGDWRGDGEYALWCASANISAFSAANTPEGSAPQVHSARGGPVSDHSLGRAGELGESLRK